MLSATAVIDLAPGTILDTASLPQPGPVAASIDVRRVEVQREAGDAGPRLTVRVQYQSFFTPEQVLQTAVPGYVIAFANAGRRYTADVPGFAFTASPFRHDLQPVLDDSVLRPDHPLPHVHASQPVRLLAAGFAMIAAGLATLLVPASRTWLGRRGPFARAARDISRLEHSPESSRDALLALHRAFDSTAGRRVLADDVEAFFREHRNFQPLRDRVAAFFAASRAAFFADGGETLPMPALRSLCRELARAERRA